MDAPTGSVSPCCEAKELCRQEICDKGISIWNVFDEATMHTDAWSSDEEHEPLPHRQGDEAEAERMLRKRKQLGRKRYVEIWDQLLFFSQGVFGNNGVAWALLVHNRPSCCQGVGDAATRTRACELIVKLHWRTFPKRPAKSRWTETGLCLAHDRTGFVWHVRYALHDRFQ